MSPISTTRPASSGRFRSCRSGSTRNIPRRAMNPDLPAQHEEVHSATRLAETKAAAELGAATVFLYTLTRPRLSPHGREETVSGRASFRRHRLGDAPVCEIHRLDVRGRAVETRLRELSPAATGHPPRRRSTGQSYGRCGPVFGRRFPFGDLSIRPHD